jgi:membrane protein implicated in regulation of membrane protease activity
MSGGQIAALVFAIILLLPGGCFLFFGVTMMSANDAIATSVAPLLLIVAAVILSLMALLFWIAFRRRRPGPNETPGNPRS